MVDITIVVSKLEVRPVNQEDVDISAYTGLSPAQIEEAKQGLSQAYDKASQESAHRNAEINRLEEEDKYLLPWQSKLNVESSLGPVNVVNTVTEGPTKTNYLTHPTLESQGTLALIPSLQGLFSERTPAQRHASYTRKTSKFLEEKNKARVNQTKSDALEISKVPSAPVEDPN